MNSRTTTISTSSIYINTTTTNLLTTTANNSNSTGKLPEFTGYLFLLGSSFFYGSNYLPVKQFQTGDGMFFQLILCLGIWTVSVIINAIRKFPTFYALPILGGAIWATGNICTVVIIKTIGIGLGILIWGGVSLVTGWATARFDLFGLDQPKPTKTVINYIGVALILCSTIFYLFVEPDAKLKLKTKKSIQKDNDDTDRIIEDTSSSVNQVDDDDPSEPEGFFDRYSAQKKRIVGLCLAVFSGLMYGQCNTPILYIRDNYSDASQNSMDYLFSYYTGIFISSLFYFIIYCIVMKNRPVLYPQIILPALISGWMWGLANICYFLSINVLAQAVSFPISNSGPPIVSNLWGIFLYKEIKGRKNLTFLLVGFAISIAGAVLCGISS